MTTDALVNILLLTFIAICAIAILRLRDLFGVAMIFGLFSLIAAGLFTTMDAPDVAFTEAAVGAGIATILTIVALGQTARRESPRSKHSVVLPLAVVWVTGAALLYGTADLPAFGDPQAPAHQHVAPYYIQNTYADMGIPNMVAAVLASYRGYDTLGEVVVVFAAVVGVFALLGLAARPAASAAAPDSGEHQVLMVVAKLAAPLILLFALYVQFHGEYSPGGGFQAGVLFGAGIILYALVFGLGPARRVIPPRLLPLLPAIGVLIFAGTGVLNILLGGNYLDYNTLGADHQIAQQRGIIMIEIGVGVTVASVMLSLYFSFAERAAARRANHGEAGQ